MVNNSSSEIIIRKAKLGDEKGIAEMSREGLRRKKWLYTGRRRITKEGLKELRKGFKSGNPNSYIFVAVDKSKKKIVGSISISFNKAERLKHRADLGWGVHPDYQSRGIGTKLLRESLKFARRNGFRRADAEVAIENRSSWKLARKCGFKIEGIKKRALLTDDGKYINVYIIGRLL